MKLYNEDCVSAIKKLIEKNIKFDAIICDPPYATTNNINDKPLDWKNLWPLLFKLLKNDNCPIILFGHEIFAANLIVSNQKDYKYKWIVNKKYATNHLNSKKQPLRIIDEIMVFSKKTPVYYPQKFKGPPNHSAGDLLKQNTTNNNYNDFKKVESDKSGLKYPINYLEFDYHHPSIRTHHQQKPVSLMEYLILTYTLPGQKILDFTMGSGSTGVACKNLNRDFVGIEKDLETFKLAKKRIEEN